jgi:DNA helicase-2/ATP-dependent DNA helicase PcrA
MCVLYRTNFQSRVLEDQLVKNKIPYKIVGGISFYQRKEIKDLLSVLRLVDNLRDQVSFLRALHLPKRGFGEVTVQKMVSTAAEQGLSCYELMHKVVQEKNFSTLQFNLTTKQKEGWLQFVQMIQELRATASSSLEALIQKTLFQTKYEQILDEEPETKKERLENIQEFVAKAKEWERERQENDEEATLSRFLEEISLVSSLDQSNHSEESLTLMTLHNGKGLEFHTAFLVGIEEDILPHINSRDTPLLVEEERRLFYVGITRAKRKLFLSYASCRMLWGSTRTMRPSRFLREIPQELIQKISNTSSFSPYVPPAPKPQTSRTQAAVTGQKGEVVFHPQFGIGMITGVHTSSLGPILEIHFSKDNKTRSLAAKHAPLSKLDA